MSDAVIVAAARTPIGRAHKGSLERGARTVVSMIHELQQRGQSIGVVAMCAGGGIGSALVLELL